MIRLNAFWGRGLDLLKTDGSQWSVTYFGGLAQFAPEPVVEDFDGDGYDDFAAVDWIGDGRVKIRFGGPAAPPFATVAQSSAVFGSTPQLTGPDFDGDGDRDIVIISLNGAVVLRNDGARVFHEVSPAPFISPVGKFAALDVDGDGLDDLVVSRNAPGSVDALDWMRSIGTGHFEPRQPLLFGGAPLAERLAVADVDQDGDEDLVIRFAFASGSNRTSAWVEMGPGTQATLHRNHLAHPSDTNVIGDVVDVDLDGVLDFLTFQPADDSLLWVRGLGGGAFDAPVEVGVIPGLRGATAVDLDGDGDQDLLTGDLMWFENLSVLSVRTCPGAPNSMGVGASLFAAGSALAAVNRTTLNAVGLPPGAFGMFITSTQAAAPVQPPGSLGDLCIGGAIGRFNRSGEIRAADSAGVLHLPIDTSQIPDAVLTTVSVLPPERRFFQLWYRDTVAGAATSNFSGAAFVDFR